MPKLPGVLLHLMLGHKSLRLSPLPHCCFAFSLEFMGKGFFLLLPLGKGWAERRNKNQGLKWKIASAQHSGSTLKARVTVFAGGDNQLCH